MTSGEEKKKDQHERIATHLLDIIIHHNHLLALPNKIDKQV